MSSASEFAALAAYVDCVQRTLVCVLEQVHLSLMSPSYSGSVDFSITLNDGRPRSVSSSLLRGLALQVAHYAQPVPTDSSHVVETVGYSYPLRIRRQDAFHELLDWQWDRRGVSPILTPHPHVSASNDLLPLSFDKLHIPTGRIEIEDVLTFLTSDLGVEPRRADWREVFSNR